MDQDTSEDKILKLPAFLCRIYDNVSLVANSNTPESGGDGVRLWGEKGINAKLGASIIDETGQLRKENWGLAEMKIAAGYLQRRDVLHIGGEEAKIVGEKGENLAILANGENGLDIEMLNQGMKGAEAIIRAVRSPIGTLGYEFFLPKPRMVGIAFGNKEFPS